MPLKPFNVLLAGAIPDALIEEFLHHIETFNKLHRREVHLSISVNAPTLTLDELQRIFNGLHWHHRAERKQ